ncbi:peptide-methionine (S)-S-oxide reductase MsrA [Undibacterium sp. RTI2.1]|uniref:peptide-methionine (S)-S-oxide reductase MsrA n=1 Tax=unclassified Undibacterium TaxID=2630295 RepID=UPI002AB36FD0|nr:MULTISPECIES: peptide-methionine (S)-S-oxide reductase MsrA [unclassified Undibacterium]MDY7536707.1 peptide-methionine (S)-S-oxide reductase MsrA [Undibacterium sp. 5I1]MEB0032102.1 peptide-methionine (S)-S-oxide reductase MsrA [Undibacterium sp. RTI2.1]MEB0118349.1 peptide-methionine (S)-S-oxide reductase MsrA [Undibacterium sp. RTI2.2]MEB0230248.1 peptide-methionine (S)-S-oxide reductase MsrA [Undibacterium sp. 10I3]MEB0257948.1 peptide-methionine (S)-S-oxide reductase MsrA [Undibacteriu
MGLETIIFGGGCFWCTEAVFQQIRGIKNVEPGYAGGHVDFPTYEDICEGDTGHAEVVRLTFDTDVVSLHALLEIFFTIHDPTSINRQGSDVGSQYRSVIYCESEHQMKLAAQAVIDVAPNWNAPIVTEVAMAPVFYPAEDYHHNYFKMNKHQRYCTIVVAPKVDKARKFFSGKLVA